MQVPKPPIDKINDKNQADLLLRYVSTLYPAQMAGPFLPQGLVVRRLSWRETQFAARQRRMDRALFIETQSACYFQHWEWESRSKATLYARIYEYHSLLMLSLLHPQTKPQVTPKKISGIESIVVLLGGRKSPFPERGEFRTSPGHSTFSGVSFRIFAVYQRTVDELIAMNNPFWLIFAPLAVDATPAGMARAIEHLRAQVDDHDYTELIAAMIAMAQKDHRKRRLYKAIIAVLQRQKPNEEITMPHWFYKLGFEKGIEKGRVSEARENLKRVLARRKLKLTRKHKASIEACNELGLLERWLEEAAVAESAAFVLASPFSPRA